VNPLQDIIYEWLRGLPDEDDNVVYDPDADDVSWESSR